MRRTSGWLALATLGLLTLQPATVLAQGVQWRQDYAAARQEAQQQGRPMMLDFGTQACAWCVKLDQTTFRDPNIVRLLNERFIPVKIDAHRNTSLTQGLKIHSFPTLVFAAPDGKILGNQEGYIEAGPLSQTLQRVIAACPSPAPKEAVAAKPPVPAPRPELAAIAPRPQIQLSIAAPEPASSDRNRQARDLLTQARENYRTRQFAGCLERCDDLAEHFADSPEAAEAQKLAVAIREDADAARVASDCLTRRLGALYLGQAESYLRQQQTPQAEACYERVLQICPGSPSARSAQDQLARLRQTAQNPTAPKVRAQSP